MEWAIEKRTGKIFIDYNMNVRGKTLNVAYSPRGVPGAPVSMPLTWDELSRRAPARFPTHQRGAAAGTRPATGGMMHLRRKQSLTKASSRAPRARPDKERRNGRTFNRVADGVLRTGRRFR